MAGAASPKLEQPPSSQDGGLALQRLRAGPTVTLSSSAEADGLLIIKVAIPAALLLGAALLTTLYMRIATTTLSSSRFGASETLRGRRAHVRSVAETELAWGGKRPREAGGLAKPSA